MNINNVSVILKQTNLKLITCGVNFKPRTGLWCERATSHDRTVGPSSALPQER